MSRTKIVQKRFHRLKKGDELFFHTDNKYMQVIRNGRCMARFVEGTKIDASFLNDSGDFTLFAFVVSELTNLPVYVENRISGLSAIFAVRGEAAK